MGFGLYWPLRAYTRAKNQVDIDEMGSEKGRAERRGGYLSNCNVAKTIEWGREFFTFRSFNLVCDKKKGGFCRNKR